MHVGPELGLRLAPRPAAQAAAGEGRGAVPAEQNPAVSAPPGGDCYLGMAAAQFYPVTKEGEKTGPSLALVDARAP